MGPLKLGDAPKTYTRDTHRVIPPRETLRHIRPALSAAGITRVADITHLDRVGIPIFSCMRPRAAQGAISVYTGKGTTKEQAEVSAIMEALERFAAEPRSSEGGLIKGSYKEMKCRYTTINPESLIIPSPNLYDGNALLRWVEGWDLIHEEEVLVLANAVFHPYWPKEDLQLFRTTTNGLASGNNIEEAILHGLMEIIERDAWSIVEVLRLVMPDIDVGSVENEVINDLIRMFQKADIEVYLKDITSDIGIPTVAATTYDKKLEDAALLTIGVGTHSNPEIAIIRALTEVAQSRLTQIHGAREDTYKGDIMRRIGYRRLKRLNRHWFTNTDQKVNVDRMPKLDKDTIRGDILSTLDILKEKGFDRVIVADITRPKINIPVVRVIVPGMEVGAIDNERVGSRIRVKFRDRQRYSPQSKKIE